MVVRGQAVGAPQRPSVAGSAWAQFYTHTSGPSGDGFTWDEEPGGLLNLPDNGQFNTPTGVSYYNFSGNNTFFDANYQAAGNAPNISGDAWWGNPLNSGFGDIGIHQFGGGFSTVSFDFAWAIAGEDASDLLEIEVFDSSNEYSTQMSVFLGNAWNAGPAFGGFMGYSGTIDLDINDLTDDNSGESFSVIDDILIRVGDISTPGGTGEFAIDNVALDGATGGNNSELVFSGNSASFEFPDGGSGTVNVLRKPGTANFSTVEIYNKGTDATTFSTQLIPGPGVTAGTPESGEFVAAGNYVLHNSPMGSVDQNSASGVYEVEAILTNDGNPSDPSRNFFGRIRLHDAPALSGSQTVDVSGGQQVTLANAAATPGGARAGVEITSTVLTGGFDQVDVVTAGAKVLPGQSISSTSITFDRYGRLSDTYNGTLTVNMEMKSQSGFFISDPDPVAPRVYNLSYNLSNTNIDTVNFANGEDFGPRKIGVNNTTMAATLIGGTSSSAQTIVMTPGGNPEFGDLDPSAELVGDPVDLSFGTPGDLYVLQYTYDENNIPVGLAETGIMPLVYDTGSSDWVDALGLNSDGGSGMVFHNGSLEDYLTATDGSLDPADLSAYGVDPANNQAWAVLDHNSLFGFGQLVSALDPADLDGDGDVDDADFGIAFAAFTGPGGTATNPAADLDGDGDVDDADFGIAFAAFTGPGGPANVPEPASLATLALGGLLLSRRRRA